MKNKLHTGELYLPNDPDIMREQENCLELQYDYNNTRPSESAKRTELMSRMFAEIGEGCYIEPPLHANWGGHHVHFGKNIYANFNLTLVDDGHIYVGDKVMFGPNVTVTTASHPVDPTLRSRGLQFNKAVYIGENAWIGAGVIIMPGIRIGRDAVVGAGSIVTRDVPERTIAVGNPCRVLREVSGRDRRFFWREEEIDWDQLQEQ